MNNVEFLERVKYLKAEVERLTHWHDELTWLANQSLIEEQIMRHRSGAFISNEVSRSYHEAAEAVSKRITEIQALLPCDDFLKRYGPELYQLYAAKYPINRETKLTEVPARSSSWNYVRPEPVPIDWLDYAAHPTAVSAIVNTVHFETWPNKDAKFYARLAFAEDINTLFVAI